MAGRVIIIGGGIAGMQAAITLSGLGLNPVIVEKEEELGGKVRQWDRLFPDMTPARRVLDDLRAQLKATSTEVLTSTTVERIENEGRRVVLADGRHLDADAILLASGFDLFPAELKEEYGYGIYENVVTSVDVERMFREGGVRMADGSQPKTIAFLHCVGSRDEKVNQRHCSRVCCITGVKQAIELKQQIPSAEIYSFYMDMRMFGPGYEELYREAQLTYNIRFVRGKISEAGPAMNNRIQIKAEDTLIGRPLKITVDMLVLIVGMKAGASNAKFAAGGGITLAPSGFVQPHDPFVGSVSSEWKNLFYAGTVTAPKNIGESINEGIAAAHRIAGILRG